ncbi:MAG: putative metallo-hydrolase [Pseudomonas citronellolis]|nr:MAG: putative metallo-hydrolase [Pseudomonas citronellolis]
MTLAVEAFFHPATSTFSYLLRDTASSACAIIDPVLDYDAAAGRLGHASAERLVARVRELGLELHWLLETHVHADHVSAASYLRERLGGRIAVGAGVRAVLAHFATLFDWADAQPDGFDRLLEEGERLPLGGLQIEVLATPGHTPACVSYRVADALFVGDTLFMPDYGTARCDFPGGDAAQLYRSIQRLYALPEATRMFLCHDYLPPGRETFCHETSVAEQRQHNLHVHAGVSQAQFVELRQRRDVNLPVPALLLPAIQLNLRAGQRPPPAANGVS